MVFGRMNIIFTNRNCPLFVCNAYQQVFCKVYAAFHFGVGNCSECNHMITLTKLHNLMTRSVSEIKNYLRIRCFLLDALIFPSIPRLD